MNHKDVFFKALHNILNNVSKRLLAEGVSPLTQMYVTPVLSLNHVN